MIKRIGKMFFITIPPITFRFRTGGRIRQSPRKIDSSSLALERGF